MNILEIHIVEQLLTVLREDSECPIIKYGDLVKKIPEEIEPINLNHPLGNISEFCKEHDMPLLSTIVVNKDTLIPGDGYFDEFFSGSKIDHVEIFMREFNRVKAYKDWDRLKELLSL